MKRLKKPSIKRLKPFFIGPLALSLLFVILAKESSQAKTDLNESCTLEATIEGPITLSTFEYLKRVFKKADQESCSSILLLMNTPGGVLSITRKIVSLILNSDLPVLCLIYPEGAHAASAGAIIHQACHYNGGLKTTHLGAATPVSGGGKDIEKDIKKKIMNDMISWLEGIAKDRKRNKHFAKDIIEKAKSVTAEEAFKIKAIDHLSRSKENFLESAKNKRVGIRSGQTKKIIVGEVRRVAKNTKEDLLTFLSHPMIAALILMGSLFLLYFEITHPGFGAPGVIGVLGLILGIMNLEVLGVMWASVLLMIFGVILFILEAFTPTFGFIGLGGGVCFVLGAFLFFDPNKTIGMEVDRMAIVYVSIFFALLCFGLAYLAWNSRKSRMKGGGTAVQILGKKGVIYSVDSEGFSGQMTVSGEIWKFESKNKLKKEDKVKVIELSENNLVLKVKKI